jgi:signal transduction histidine kinase
MLHQISGDVQMIAPSRPVAGWSQLVRLSRAALALRLLAVFVGLLNPTDRLMTPVQIIAVVIIVAMSIAELKFTEYLALLEAHPMLALVDLAIVVGFVAAAGETAGLQLTVLTTAFLVGLWVDRLGGAIAILMLVVYFVEMGMRSDTNGASHLVMAFMLVVLWVLALVMRKASDDEALSHKILRASLMATTAAEERAKLATELHDKLAKTIQSVALMTSVIPAAVETNPVSAITAARQAHQMSARAVTELRGVMSGLRNNGTDLVFGEAVIGLVSMWQSAEDRHVQLTIDEDMVLRRPDVQFEVLAALGESLDNIAQHAGACDVDVIVSKEGSTLTVVVRDTGKGFSESELRACQRVGHQRVLDVQRRLVRVGGLADVSSEVGGGTTVTMVVHDEPLEERE